MTIKYGPWQEESLEEISHPSLPSPSDLHYCLSLTITGSQPTCMETLVMWSAGLSFLKNSSCREGETMDVGIEERKQMGGEDPE